MISLAEMIAVLVLIGILAAVAAPKYFDLTHVIPAKVAAGQIGAVKSRMDAALNRYMLEHNGSQPADGNALLAFANSVSVDACPGSATTEGDFTFKCAMGTGKEILITVLEVQSTALTPVITASYKY